MCNARNAAGAARASHCAPARSCARVGTTCYLRMRTSNNYTDLIMYSESIPRSIMSLLILCGISKWALKWSQIQIGFKINKSMLPGRTAHEYIHAVPDRRDHCLTRSKSQSAPSLPYIKPCSATEWDGERDCERTLRWANFCIVSVYLRDTRSCNAPVVK